MRRFLPYSIVITLLVAVWSGWALYSRYRNVREMDASQQQKVQAQEAEADRKIIAAYGGDQLTILGFAANAARVAPGGRVVVCYGVTNAAKVKIEPGVEPIKPAISHCLNVFPKQTTRYKLTAEDGKGNSKSAELTIRVGEP